jgi:hypothetical protein
MKNKVKDKCIVYLSAFLCLFSFMFLLPHTTIAQFKNSKAVVIDERLAALRDKPDLSAKLIRRLSRGRKVSIVGASRNKEGLMFYRVVVTRRTRGWIQSESLAVPSKSGEDQRILNLIKASQGFDQLERAYLFLELYPQSRLRPAVLLIYGDAAEAMADKLSRDANNRLDEHEMQAGKAPVFTYFMNYNGLDRFNRKGVSFIYDQITKRYHYDGTRWREIVRKYPNSPESIEARKRLERLNLISKR